jgi:hypothetical protein
MLHRVIAIFSAFTLFADFAGAALPALSGGFSKPSASRAPLQVAIRFDKSFYSLDLHGEILTYKDSARTYKMPAKKCDQAVVDKIVGQYRAMTTDYKARKPIPKTEFNVEVIETNKMKLEVARGSNLGTWLRDMPKNIMYYAAEAKVACAKK